VLELYVFKKTEIKGFCIV